MLLENRCGMAEDIPLKLTTSNNNYMRLNGDYSNFEELATQISPDIALDQSVASAQSLNLRKSEDFGGLYIIGSPKNGYSLAEASGSGTGYVAVAKIILN